MNKNVNRSIIVVLIMLFLTSAALCEPAAWNCPECGRSGNTGNYCGGCGHPAPDISLLDMEQMNISDAEKDLFLSQHKIFTEASNDDPVEITSYVQDSQSWWDNKMTVYLQDPGGAYYIYEMTCTEEEASRLVPGT